jgi:hypothetical protein
VIVAQTELGRGVLGVIDGESPVSKTAPTLHGAKTCCERSATSCSSGMPRRHSVAFRRAAGLIVESLANGLPLPEEAPRFGLCNRLCLDDHWSQDVSDNKCMSPETARTASSVTPS